MSAMMLRSALRWGVLALVLALVPGTALADSGPAGRSAHRPAQLAAHPPLGWSSWSSLRGNVSEAAIAAQAQVMHDSLGKHGYVYINIDSGWTDHLDAYGRDAWNTTKFPSGMPALAAYLHKLGLRFGLYLLPGIPKAAVAANTPIYGTPYHAADIADTSTEGNTYTDAWRIDYNKPGAESYVQSYADMFASWGVDYLKMDFVGPGGGLHPADNRADIEHWHYALAHSGRPIHLELSNSLSLADAPTWQAYANGWRIEGDVECYKSCPGFLTNWALRASKRFTDAPHWTQYAGPGHWNDLDSLELGNGDVDGLTPDERVSIMTLWSIEASPLLLGTDLTKMDPADLKLITNDEVIAVDRAGHPATPLSQATPQQVWSVREPDGSYVVALFNLADTAATVTANWSDLGLAGTADARDLWAHRTVGRDVTGFSAELAPHASRLLRVTP
jgi:alpha-galactosidase